MHLEAIALTRIVMSERAPAGPGLQVPAPVLHVKNVRSDVRVKGSKGIYNLIVLFGGIQRHEAPCCVFAGIQSAHESRCRAALRISRPRRKFRRHGWIAFADIVRSAYMERIVACPIVGGIDDVLRDTIGYGDASENSIEAFPD